MDSPSPNTGYIEALGDSLDSGLEALLSLLLIKNETTDGLYDPSPLSKYTSGFLQREIEFPSLWQNKEVLEFSLPRRLTDPYYGEEEMRKYLGETIGNAPSLEQVRQITSRLPSLSRLILEERHNE